MELLNHHLTPTVHHTIVQRPIAAIPPPPTTTPISGVDLAAHMIPIITTRNAGQMKVCVGAEPATPSAGQMKVCAGAEPTTRKVEWPEATGLQATLVVPKGILSSAAKLEKALLL